MEPCKVLKNRGSVYLDQGQLRVQFHELDSLTIEELKTVVKEMEKKKKEINPLSKKERIDRAVRRALEYARKREEDAGYSGTYDFEPPIIKRQVEAFNAGRTGAIPNFLKEYMDD